MVPLIFAFLLLGESSAKIDNFDELVDKAIGQVYNVASFFGYDSLDITRIDKTFNKKFLFFDVKAGLVCDKGSLEIKSLKRSGPAQANIVNGLVDFTMTLQVPRIDAEIGQCTFSISNYFKAKGTYKAFINDTTAGARLRVVQEGKQCRLQVANATVNVGEVYVYSGASFVRALQDWTFDAVSYLIEDTAIEKANEMVLDILKKYAKNLVSFPCSNQIKG